MVPPRTTVEWRVVLDDEEWHRDDPLQTLLTRGDRQRAGPRRTRGTAMLTLIALLVAALLFLGQRDPRAASGRGSSAQENQASEVALAARQARVAGPQVPARWEMTCYWEAASGQRRLRPLVALWGARQSLTSERFHFRFRQRDATAVEAAAPRLDAIYARVAANFGLAPEPGGERLTVHLDLAARAAIDPHLEFTNGHLTVAPPDCFPLDAVGDAAELLVQSVTPALVHHLVDRGTDHLSPQWAYRLRNGLRLWQMWDLDDPLTGWMPQLVRWRYAGSLAGRATAVEGAPQALAALCRAYAGWGVEPYDVWLPLACSPRPTGLPQGEVAVSIEALSPLESGDADRPGQRAPSPLFPAFTVAILFDHVADRYGRESLPSILEELNRHPDWRSGIPAVFGVDPATFEARWRDHVKGFQK